jgi:putative ABC transport system permease protein
MKWLRQVIALLQMGIESWRQRPASVLVTVLSIACVVGVLVAMLSMGTSVRAMMNYNVRADRALVLSKGAIGRVASSIDRSSVSTVAELPDIKRDADGKPLATAVYPDFMFAYRKSDNSRATFPMNGVDQRFFKVYPEWHLTEGRNFTPGKYEMVVGKSRHEQFKGLEIGDVVHLRGIDWTVVGHYDMQGGEYEGSVLVDLDTMISAYHINNAKTIAVVLNSPQAFAGLQKTLADNPSLSLEIKTEKEILAREAQSTSGIMDFISYFVGTVMAIGATLGAINAMYALIDGRKREIATLRAIGFGNFPIVVSVMLESLLITIPGALLGVLLAWLFFNGNAVSPLGASIKLLITPLLAISGIIWALFMGLIGGLFPAIRAARIQVANALRAV